MKLLFTQDALASGGAERSHLEILSRFSKEVDVGFVYFYPKHDLKPEYNRAGIRLFFLDIPESYHFHLAIYRLVRLIKKEKPDVLVSCLWRADIITRIASTITRVPLVGTLVNDSYAPIAWNDKKGLKYKIVYWLDRWTAGIPVHWIANAQAMADSHVRTLGLKREKISVVHRGRAVPVMESPGGNVIAMELPSRADEGSAAISRSEQEKINKTASSAESSEIKSELFDSSLAVTSSEETAFPDSIGIEVTGQIRNFISYGRLLERKGFQDAIQAFAQVLKIYPDCTLTIFGEGSYRNKLETIIEELDLKDSVFLPGKIPNPIDALINGYYLQTSSTRQVLIPSLELPNPRCSGTQPDNCQLLTADCFLFPSWYEGFSGALVEAMMAGIPIIASDIPMNLEAVAHQKSALIFPVQNIETLKDYMLWAIENPVQMETFGKEARRTAVDRFDIEKITFSYEEVLKGLSRNLSTK